MRLDSELVKIVSDKLRITIRPGEYEFIPINGEVRQNSNTSNMIFSVEKLVSYISHYFTLYTEELEI